jgi:hypothetical protein
LFIPRDADEPMVGSDGLQNLDEEAAPLQCALCGMCDFNAASRGNSCVCATERVRGTTVPAMNVFVDDAVSGHAMTADMSAGVRVHELLSQVPGGITTGMAWPLKTNMKDMISGCPANGIVVMRRRTNHDMFVHNDRESNEPTHATRGTRPCRAFAVALLCQAASSDVLSPRRVL